ncbi:MAG: acylphosphatase [Cyclobacteriaceae bacterium]|nr:acylphosphatase [Cyclobacteriaceae bacterium]
MKRVSIRISGKVQGVFYRASTVEKAHQLNLKGLVRNESDGSVFVEAEGDENKLKELIAWCKIGPPRAQVNDVEITEHDKVKNFYRFEIVR